MAEKGYTIYSSSPNSLIFSKQLEAVNKTVTPMGTLWCTVNLVKHTFDLERTFQVLTSIKCGIYDLPYATLPPKPHLNFAVFEKSLTNLVYIDTD